MKKKKLQNQETTTLVSQRKMKARTEVHLQAMKELQ